MSESNQKRQYYDKQTVDFLSDKYKFSREYIQMSIKGTRYGKVSQKIAMEYKVITDRKDEAFNDAIKGLE